MANKEINDFTELSAPLPPDLLLIQDAAGVTKYVKYSTIKDGNYKSYDGLLLKRNVTNPNYQIDLDYTTLWIEGVKSTAGNFTLDITASGLLGLDTGSESADSWYYVWAIATVGGVVSAILSASATAPTMPTGYTLKRLVSMVRNTSGNFVDFVQQGKFWSPTSSTLMIAINAPDAGTARDLSIYMPEQVYKYNIQLLISAGKTSGAIDVVYIAEGYINGSYFNRAVGTIYDNSVVTKTLTLYQNATVSTYNRNLRTFINVTSADIQSMGIYLSSFEVEL